MLDTQTMVDVSWNSQEQKMEAFYIHWKSNVTFDNRFLQEKKKLLIKLISSLIMKNGIKKKVFLILLVFFYGETQGVVKQVL